MKKRLITIVVCLLAILLLIGIIPFGKDIHYSGTAYEYALAGDGAVAEHEVFIDGTYYSSLFLKDRFWGTFYLNNVEGLTADMHVNFAFEPKNRYHPVFLGEAGQSHSTEIAVIFFERNFETLAIQFTTKYEKDGYSITGAYSDSESNFLVIGTQNKEEALSQYIRMLEEKR